MKTLKSAFAERLASYTQDLTRVRDCRDRPENKHVEAAFKALVACEPKAEINVFYTSVYIDVPVKSMKHMAECLEFFQAKLGIEFDHSTDFAASGTREFSSTGLPWLVIRALTDENDAEATCKRVLKGYKTVEQAVYELECKD